MYKVEADKSKKLLEIAFAGAVDAAAAKACVDRVELLVAGLAPGFTLLNDMSELVTMDVDCAPHMERSMELCKKAGVVRVVRIIPDPHKDIGLSILSIFHYPRRIKIITCETREEALKLLT